MDSTYLKCLHRIAYVAIAHLLIENQTETVTTFAVLARYQKRMEDGRLGDGMFLRAEFQTARQT